MVTSHLYNDNIVDYFRLVEGFKVHHDTKQYNDLSEIFICTFTCRIHFTQSCIQTTYNLTGFMDYTFPHPSPTHNLG